MFYDLGMYGRDLNIGRGKRVQKTKTFWVYIPCPWVEGRPFTGIQDLFT